MEKKRINNHVRHGKAIRKIFVALLTGGLTYSVTTISEQPQIWMLTISVFISGVTLLAQSMIDSEGQLENVAEKLEGFAEGQAVHLNAIESLITEGFTKTNEATELFRAVEESPLPTDLITQLVRYSTQIEPDSPPLVNKFAQSQISRTSQFLKELSEGGVVSHEGEDREWLLDLTIQSEKTIDATSLSTVDAGVTGFHGGLWTSDFGQRYLKLQRDAVLRGVTIRRVFIFDGSEQAKDSDFLRIYQQHQDLGIRTRVLDRLTISHAHKSGLFDFIVFDDAITYEATPSSRVDEDMCPSIVKTHLTLRPQLVKERRRRFEELWDCAQDFG